jgi:membrane fusion protein, adhesin transport system
MSDQGHAAAVGAAHYDADREPRRIIFAMVLLVLLFLVVAVAWSALAELDVAAQARGAVVAPSRLQEVQSLEGGIVQQMLVVPGQVVKKGQVLARLDSVQYNADLGESRQQQLGALASRARVEALLTGKEPRFEAELRSAAPELVAKETQLWRDSLREYQTNMQALKEVVLRKKGELAEATARIQALQASVKLGEESFAIEEKLFKEGAGARADFLNAQQRLLTQKTELDGLQQSLPRLSAGLAEAQAGAAEVDAKARALWGAQRSEFETKAASLASTVAGRQDRVARRELLSPMDGVVNRVLVSTQGGVVAPGKAIVEVVPSEAPLQMNVRIRPTDIGFVRAGQKANVRVQAYDPSTYGKVEAFVARVGADAVVDERGEAYFEVQLSAARDQLQLHGQPLPITPGMPVDVGIITGRRSVMQYMLKPVLRGLQGALQER